MIQAGGKLLHSETINLLTIFRIKKTTTALKGRTVLLYIFKKKQAIIDNRLGKRLLSAT
jgi:hypothetical protein